VRPGGLTDKPPSAPILYSSEDTLFGGSISRKQVALVAASACSVSEASNKVVEIVATEDAEFVSVQEGFSSV